MSRAPQRTIDLADLLIPVRNEVVGLLFNRYVFRTLQEIVRRNKRLQGQSRRKFSDWSQVIYGVATSVGIRRLTSEHYQRRDISLIKILDDAIRDPSDLWTGFEKHFPNEAESAMLEARQRGSAPFEADACRRLLGDDRALLFRQCKKAIEFANKRAAHSNLSADVRTKFRDLDQAIDAIRTITEKFILLLYDQPYDLFAEMLSRKILPGWDAIFLEPWATRETLALSLGEMEPPLHS
ncbi:MAG: hypothetical protein Q7S58_18540 [Candidatus Binatus sp.]|uniref:hypothetical protein n=1 Tax=Candidatus Binatus sp. TaxID=2811406 RepID=UPI002728DABA|nr:hypothetical protein [Candidatus Binatus sp.]MDO8434404.1 hypothetical protein [Candidatus Binatus sp.]